MDPKQKEFYEYFRDGDFLLQEAEALARAGESRSRGDLLTELVVPVGTGLGIVMTETAFRFFSRWARERGPQYFRRMGLKLATRTAIAGTTAGTAAAASGPAAPVSGGMVFAAMEIYSLIEITFTMGLDIYTMWRDFPTADEALDLLPAAVIVQLQMAKYLQGDTKQLVRVTTKDIAMAAAYVAHCTESLSVEDERKKAAYAALIGAWNWGYIPAAYLPLIHRAHKRMKPYMGDVPDALIKRFEEFLGVYAKYGGNKCLKSGRLFTKVAQASLSAYNIYVMADNTIDSYCRTIDCDYVKLAAAGAVDFMMSPSNYELQLPWKPTCPADSVCISTIGEVDSTTQTAIDKINSTRVIMRPVSEVNRAVSEGEILLDSLDAHTSEEP